MEKDRGAPTFANHIDIGTSGENLSLGSPICPSRSPAGNSHQSFQHRFRYSKLRVPERGDARTDCFLAQVSPSVGNTKPGGTGFQPVQNRVFFKFGTSVSRPYDWTYPGISRKVPFCSFPPGMPHGRYSKTCFPGSLIPQESPSRMPQ